MKKILIVDDEPGIIKVIQTRLEANKFEVFCASDGKKALEVARKEKPDCIVLDVIMPEMDGFSVVQEIKRDDEIKKIPIIILTAKEELGDIFEMEGVCNYLTKPFNSEELIEKINKVMS